MALVLNDDTFTMYGLKNMPCVMHQLLILWIVLHIQFVPVVEVSIYLYVLQIHKPLC
jgi:hypothetical protein